MNLPEVHESHEQEFESIFALLEALKNYNFIIRNTRDNDYGVDITIEPKIVQQNGKKYASNYLCQIQVKNKKNSTKILTKDGKYSYPIEVKTLNYLSKHPGSIFMIYLENEKYFVWDWIYNIENYVVNNSNTSLEDIKEKTVNYQFSRKLNDEDIKEIHRNILEIGEKLNKLKSIIINNSIEEVNVQEKILTKIKKNEEELKKLVNNKDYKKAFDKYSAIAKLVDEEESYLVAAIIGSMAGKHKETSYYCNNAIRLNKDNYIAHFLNGISYVKRGKMKKAEEAFRKSIDIHITLESLIELGKITVMQNRISEAIYYFGNAYFIDSENVYINLTLGCLYYGISQFSKSLYHLNKLIANNNADDFIYGLIASNYLDVGKNELAEEYFKKAYQIKNDTGYLVGLSVSLYLNNKINEANDLVNKCSLNSEFSNTNKKIAFIYAGWKKSVFIKLTDENYIDEVKIIDNDKRCGLDYIFIAIIRDKNGIDIPVVGKNYNRFDDYGEALKQIKKRTNLIEDAFSNHQSVDFDNKTKLYLKEEKDNIFIRIDIGGYIIEGNTDIGRKDSFPQFIKAYNKFKYFQVEFHEEESNKFIFYMVEGNLTYKTLNE
jgi:Putative Zn-dependent protease, contains TPR repeats